MAWEDRSSRIDHESPRYVWEQIADDLRAEIRSGELAPAARLPGDTELAEIYGVARLTVRRAIRALREEGTLIVKPGKGTYVSEQS